MEKHPARRYAVIALALVVAFSVISPAVGGPSPLTLAKKAVKKSKAATKKAKSATKKAKGAKKQARAAGEAAAGANALATANAGEIDELKDLSPALKCPEGMVKTADLCYESSDRTNNWNDALTTCVNADRRVPSPAEGLLMVKDIDPANADEGGPVYWTDAFDTNDVGGQTAIVVRKLSGFGLGLAAFPIGGAEEYRCVTSPSL